MGRAPPGAAERSPERLYDAPERNPPACGRSSGAEPAVPTNAAAAPGLSLRREEKRVV